MLGVRQQDVTGWARTGGVSKLGDVFFWFYGLTLQEAQEGCGGEVVRYEEEGSE